MCPAAEILVYILSAFLLAFLIIGIILGIYLIILTKKIRSVTQSAEKTVNDIGSVVSKASKIIQPIFIVETVTSILNKVKNKKGDK